MFRNLYTTQNLLNKIVGRQYQKFKHEEFSYISAFLARSRHQLKLNQRKKELNIEDILKNIKLEMTSMEINQHEEIAKGDHLEQLFNLFENLNQTLRDDTLILNQRYQELSTLTALVDPDQFPIFSLIQQMEGDDLVSIWDYKKELKRTLCQKHGFILSVKQSTIQHHLAGQGVFVTKILPQVDAQTDRLKLLENQLQNSNFSESLDQNEQSEERKINQDEDRSSKPKQKKKVQRILPGTLLALFPGITYSSFSEFESLNIGKRDCDMYIHRYDDFILDFTTDIPYPYKSGFGYQNYIDLIKQREKNKENEGSQSIKLVSGNFINPYAVAHKINHPPKGVPANSIVLDIEIPIGFFGEEMMKFLPVFTARQLDQANTKSMTTVLKCVGVFALREIQDGEELFIDYIHSNLYSTADVPDWLVQPPSLNAYLKKDEFENEASLIIKIIDNYISKNYLNEYQRFLKQISNEPQEPLNEEQQQAGYFNQILNQKNQKK